MKTPTFPNHRSLRTLGLSIAVAGCIAAAIYSQEPESPQPVRAGQTPAAEPATATPAPVTSAAPAAPAIAAPIPVLPPPPTAAVPQPPLPATPAVPVAPDIPGAGLPPGPSIEAAPSAGASASVVPARARAGNRIRTTLPLKRAQNVARTAIDEELAGDPQSTVRDYEAIIAEFDRQREDAAQAIFRLAEALRKLGRIEEARVQYSRILREFVDFPELARLSQQQLSQNTANPSQPAGDAIPSLPASPEERSLLKEELGLLEEQLARAKSLAKEGLAPEGSVLPIQRDILQIKRQLARLAATNRNVDPPTRSLGAPGRPPREERRPVPQSEPLTDPATPRVPESRGESR